MHINHLKQVNNQSGFTLIEVLVAVLVMAVGLLGIASLQASAISSTTTSAMRTTAAISTQSLVARMRANKAYWRYQSATDAAEDAAENGTATGTDTLTVEVNDSGETIITNKNGDSFGDLSLNCALVNANCTPQQMAVYDLSEWFKKAQGNLVEPVIQLSTLPAENSNLQRIRINLRWKEKKLGGGEAVENSNKLFSDYSYSATVRI